MSLTLTRNRIIIIAIGAIIVAILVGFIIFGKNPPQPGGAANLSIWGVFESQNVWSDIISKYRNAGGAANITFKTLNSETYESELINALAAGKGPDIFMFHNTWLPKHIDKIVPVAETKIPLVNYIDVFPQVVNQDFTANGKIYAAPLYVDTLAMFYNKDTFDRKGIAVLPRDWTEFKNLIQTLREINPQTNEILKAGAAIGGSEKSINRATDILNLLMLQSGAKMVDGSFSNATFAAYFSGGKNPGLTSLDFYTQFANPASTYYTWNDNQHYSIDSFTEGATAIIFNYSHQIPIFKSKNPFLNFGVAPVPQIQDSEQPITYANYWGLAVSNKSKNADAAWDFITYATTNEDAAALYGSNTKRPPALKTLINKKLSDIDLGVFAKQALIARSWPQIDNVKIEDSFSRMIESVLSGKLTTIDALKKAEEEITQLMRLKK